MFKKNEYIYTVYQEKSFSKAAQKLFIAQPSLSAAVKKIENELGSEIFDRKANPVQLTEFGKHYIRAIEQIQELENSIRELARESSCTNHGSIVVGSNSLYVTYVLPEYVFKFIKQYPNIDLKVFESNTEALGTKLLENGLDIILDNRELTGDVFEKCYFGTEFLLVAVPRNFPCNQRLTHCQLTYDDILNDRHISANVVPFEEFRDTPFITMTAGNDTRSRTDMIFNHYNIHPKSLMELNQLSSVFAFSRTGSAACIISDTLIKRSSWNSEDLYFYALPPSLSRRDVFLQYKKKNANKLIPLFINTFVRNVI